MRVPAKTAELYINGKRVDLLPNSATILRLQNSRKPIELALTVEYQRVDLRYEANNMFEYDVIRDGTVS